MTLGALQAARATTAARDRSTRRGILPSVAQAVTAGRLSRPPRAAWHRTAQLLTRITRGQGEIEDIARLEKLGEVIKKASLCGLGQTAPNPVLTTLRYFRNEYLEHIKDGRCRAVVCKDLIEYRVIKEKCTGCQACVRVCPTGAITGPRSEPHNVDATKCIKCRSCYVTCRFEAIAGDAIVIRSAEKKS